MEKIVISSRFEIKNTVLKSNRFSIPENRVRVKNAQI